MQYCPYDLLAQRENVIFGGTPTTGTSLLVSPFDKRFNAQNDLNSSADTSVGIALHAIDRGLLDSSLLVSSDSFSVDALAGIYFLVDQGQNISVDLLTALSRMAIYEHGDDRDVAHINFILNSWTHPVDSPLHAEMFKQSAAYLANVLYEELLQRLAKIVDKVDYLERYWTKEEEKLSLSEALLHEGVITLQTNEELDLAVFKIPPSELRQKGRLFEPYTSDNTPWHNRVHRIALHNLSSCSRILLQSATKRFFYFRADSSILARREHLKPRGDLSPIATKLNDMEGLANLWRSTPIDEPRSALWTEESQSSGLSDEEFIEALASFLNGMKGVKD
ncbi:MAG TPA: DUF6687 family protein [Oculatellaceae cyanobacterium]